MKYQKARFIEKGLGDYHFWGKELWVKAAPPTMETAQDVLSHEIGRSSSFLTAVMGTTPFVMLVEADCIELLPEFQDDVRVL